MMIDGMASRGTLALLAATLWTAAAEAQMPVPSTRRLTVDLSNRFRPATHVASGSLYGLGKEGMPERRLIRPTKPRVFTQMAPGGTQVPVGDALKVAAMAADAGAKVTIRMPDIYPNFPYLWKGLDDWRAKVEGVVDANMRSGASNIYAYELWNEPNGTWNTAAAGSFLDVWTQTYRIVRAKDRDTPVMGPSIDRYDEAYMRAFLTAAKTDGTLPDIVSWHELGYPEGNYFDTANTPRIGDHVRRYRALEASLGIEPRPIAINEYGVTTEEGVPGSMVRYFAQFERHGVDSANVAFWFGPGRLSNLVTDDAQPNGGWWLFKWYGDMTGQMAMTTPAAAGELSLDGIASVDPDGRTAHVLFGGADGDNLIAVEGFAAPFRDTAHVTVEATPWYGPDDAVLAPTTVLEGDFAIVDGRISVPVTETDKSYGYRMTLSPSGARVTRYEAERAVAPGLFASTTPTASNASYLARFGTAGQSMRFNVDMERAGEYDLQVRFANGDNAEASGRVRVNRGEGRAIAYPRTGGWLADERTGLATLAVPLKRGSNIVELDAGAGRADIDYVQFTPRRKGSIRIEAERAALGASLIEPSSYASGQSFVAPNGNRGFVEFRPDVPVAGTYMLDIGYASMTAGGGGHVLTVNGVDTGRVSYASTGARFRAVPTKNPRAVRTVPVALVAGRNTIRLAYDLTGYVELDYIELRGDVVRYEAEAAVLADAHVADGAVGTRYVEPADARPAAIRFAVAVASPGRYRLRIAYGSGGTEANRQAMTVNGGAVQRIDLAAAGSLQSSPARFVETEVTLRKGSNSIALSGIQGQIDYVEVWRD